MLAIAVPIRVSVGKLGVIDFAPGVYIYTGRAARGLAARLERHRLKEKPRRWHIDYLTTHPLVEVRSASVVSTYPEQECQVNQLLQRQPGSRIPAPGFGSSDCRRTADRPACLSHLTWIGAFEER